MKDDHVYLLHIRDAIERFLSFTQNGRNHFLKDAMVQDAVIRNFEIIGEAAKNISDTYRQGQNQVPWKIMAGLRDKLIHDYFGVNLNIIWETVEKDIPILKDQISNLIDKKK